MFRLISVFFAALTLACWRVDPVVPVFIAVDPKTTYQTMVGWEATAEIGQTDCVPPNMEVGGSCPASFLQWRDAALDAAAELGINRLRITIKVGIENTRDWHADWIAGRVTHKQKNQGLMQLINDNNNPNSINPNGFQWGSLDFRMDNVVLPLKQRLQARNEQLHLNFMYDGQDVAQLHRDNPAEYAEFTLAIFQHMKSKYGFVPDSWEIMNEPDNGTGWTATQIGQALAAVGPRLAAAGFRPRFVAPSTTSGPAARFWLNEIVAVTGAQQYLKEVSYHRYGNIDPIDLARLRERARAMGMDTSMLEWIGGTHETLHEDLKVGYDSAWQQFTLAYPSSKDGGGAYFIVNYQASKPVVVMGSRTKFLRQYFKYVRAGAQRIGAASSTATFDPLAFRNTDGKFVVVVKTEVGGRFSVHGLPAGTYGIKYTTPSRYDVDLPNVTITAGQPVETSIPESGVVTIYATS